MNRSSLYKRLFTLLGIIAVVIASWQLLIYLNTFQLLTLTYDTSYVDSVNLYRSDTLDPSQKGNLVDKLTSGKTYRLKKGVYIYEAVGDKVENSDHAITLSDKPYTETLDLDYASSHLQSLLSSQESTIHNSITASNPKISQLYQINSGFLYHHGEWYGTTLSYKGSDTLSRDTLRVVAHQVNGKWQLVTNPPQIILSSVRYPSIPHSILSAVNAIDIGPPALNKVKK